MSSSTREHEHATPAQPANAVDRSHADSSHRLPSSVRPSHYQLHLTPNLTSFVFTASVTITLSILQPTHSISLNAAELDIKSATLTRSAAAAAASSPLAAASSPLAASISYRKEDEVAVFTFDSELQPGDAELAIEYTGQHNDKMRGCYRSKYRSVRTGRDEWMVVTQFESTDARRALPCFDEPALKATFTVELTVDPLLKAVSNMPIVDSREEQQTAAGVRMVTHRFDRTPVMSTYLLAWCVGEFDVLEDTTSDGIVIRCFTPVGRQQQGKFALDCAIRILPFYNSFFQYKYPLPKLDMLAIQDFAAGAMENWGMVTYRSSALLIDEENSSAMTRQAVALCVVTMDWWSGLWLNEGFATWMENFATDRLFPSWRCWDQFVYSDVNSALSLDALLSSHPIEVEVERAEDVDEIFDAISYSKGSVVVRLLEDYLGIDCFTRGIQAYIARFEYRNATTEDLWAELQAVSGRPVKEMMERWTRHVGFPLLTLTEPKEEGGGIVFGVKQRRFLVTGVKEDDDTLWFVPVSFLVSGRKQHMSQQILRERQGQLRLEGAGRLTDIHWIKINPNQTGPYRVQYPASMLAQFRTAIEKDEHGVGLSASDRLGLQNDLFALARAGLIPTSSVLEFIGCYAEEEEYVVWADLLGNIAEMADVLKHTDAYDAFAAFVRRLISRIVQKVGWDKRPSDDHCAALLRARVLVAGVKYEDESVRAEAEKRFSRFMEQQKLRANGSEKREEKAAATAALPADIRSAVYSCVVKHGGAQAYETMLQLQSQSELQEEKVRCLHALAAATEPELVQRSIEYGFSDSVRSQDAPSFIAALGSNRKATHALWAWLQQHWERVIDRFGGTTGLSRIVAIVDNFSQQQQADEVDAFFASHQAPAAQQAVRQAIENLKANATYLKRDGENIKKWLQEHAKTG